MQEKKKGRIGGKTFVRIDKNAAKRDKTNGKTAEKMSRRIARGDGKDVKMSDKNVVRVEEKMFRKIVKDVRTQDKVAAKMRKANDSSDRAGRAMSVVNACKDNKAGKTEAIKVVDREAEIAADSLIFHNPLLIFKSNSFSRYNL